MGISAEDGEQSSNKPIKYTVHWGSWFSNQIATCTYDLTDTSTLDVIAIRMRRRSGSQEDGGWRSGSQEDGGWRSGSQEDGGCCGWLHSAAEAGLCVLCTNQQHLTEADRNKQRIENGSNHFNLMKPNMKEIYEIWQWKAHPLRKKKVNHAGISSNESWQLDDF